MSKPGSLQLVASQPAEPESHPGSGLLKILIVRLGALGDIIHAIPAQQAIASQYPEAEIHWLTKPAYRDLLNCVEDLARVWVFDDSGLRSYPSRFLSDWWSLTKQLRAEKFDYVFDFQGLLISAFLARNARARQSFGFQPERFKETGCSWLYDVAIEGEADLSRHVVETNSRLVSRALETGPVEARISLNLSQRDLTYVNEQLSSREMDRPILINPGAGWKTKLWDPVCYGELALLIEEELGIPVLFTYGPGEEKLLETIREACPTLPVRTFPSTIPQLAALCQQSRLMIAGDCGPLHLAVAQGTPTVAILGPTNPTRNGPFNSQDLVVKRELPCSDSYRRTCSEFICMNIPVAQVFETVAQRLDRLKPTRHLVALSST